MYYGLIAFVLWAEIVAVAAAFLLGLASKWGILEWLQIHAPSDFLHELFSCKFCCSWWVSLAISLTLCVVTGNWWLILLPFCTTVITRELW